MQEKLLEQVVQAMLPIFGIVLMAFLTAAVKKALAWMGIQMTAAQEEALRKKAEELVLAMEENATAMAKALPAMSGQMKALTVVEALKYANPKLSTDEAKSIVQATVARLPGIGATGNRTALVGGGRAMGECLPAVQT